jgi:Flp pilus assembly pilin Flp
VKPFKQSSTGFRGQDGQAYVEYLVVTCAVAAALVVPLPGSTDALYVLLASSLKSFFSAYSFTLSLP